MKLIQAIKSISYFGFILSSSLAISHVTPSATRSRILVLLPAPKRKPSVPPDEPTDLNKERSGQRNEVQQCTG